jgi:hypothetical protein
LVEGTGLHAPQPPSTLGLDRRGGAEKTGLFDHLIGADEDRRRDRQTEGLDGFEVDDQLKGDGLLDR